MKKILIGLGLLSLALPAQSQEWKQDFETVGSELFAPLGGQASAGSSIVVSNERARSGQKSAKLAFRFSGKGYIELHAAQRPTVVSAGDKLYLSLSVYGAGQEQFSGGGLRLVDAAGEVFQFRMPAEFTQALNGTGWRSLRAEIDLTKTPGHWGGDNDGVMDMPLKWLGFGLDHGATTPGEGVVFLDDMQMSTQPMGASGTPPAPTNAATKLTLTPVATSEPEKQFYFYAPGATVRIAVKAANLPAGISSARWIARDFGGQTLAQGQAALDASGAGEIAVSAAKPGIVYVSATILSAADEALAEGDTRFAYLQPRPGPAPVDPTPQPVLYAVAAHLVGKSDADMKREVSLMAALGFRGCRFDQTWGSIQPARDQWRWEKMDAIYTEMERNGVVPLPLLAYTARWASTGDLDAKDWRDWGMAPPVTEDYVRFAQESARRYGRYTRYWEIWNEPDIAFWRGTAEQYATLFSAAKRGIKEVQPQAVVMNGGFSETRRRPEFIPDWQKATQEKPDVFAYHSHGGFGNLIRAGEHIKSYLQTAGWTMPVWLNEAGFSSMTGSSERDQAYALVKKMSYAPALGFTGYVWYDLRNDGTDLNENEHNFGLVRHNFTPKAAAVAAHTLTEALQGQRFVRRIPVPGLDSAYALLFARPGGAGGTLVLWNEATATVPLFWPASAGARRISIMGERSEVAARNGLVMLAAAPEPQILSIDGSVERFAPAGRLLELDPTLIAAPEQTVPLRVRVRNPLDQPLRGTLTLTPAGGWKVGNAALDIDVAAGGQREFEVPVTAPATDARSQELLLNLSSPSLPDGGTARVRLQSALVVPRRADAGTAGDFSKWTTPLATLGSTNIVSLFLATPMTELHFKGNDDLSAQIHLARVPQGLQLAVRVRDNVHHQTEEPNSEWRGDSIQFALALPTGEHYEWLAALAKNGPVAYLNIAPAGVATGRATMPFTCRREGNETLYELVIPPTLPGGKALPDRFSINVIVNDNDGAGRKGWAEWTPGIGVTKDPTLFQPVVVR